MYYVRTWVKNKNMEGVESKRDKLKTRILIQNIKLLQRSLVIYSALDERNAIAYYTSHRWWMLSWPRDTHVSTTRSGSGSGDPGNPPLQLQMRPV
jgi:hypothetical protein